MDTLQARAKLVLQLTAVARCLHLESLILLGLRFASDEFCGSPKTKEETPVTTVRSCPASTCRRRLLDDFGCAPCQLASSSPRGLTASSAPNLAVARPAGILPQPLRHGHRHPVMPRPVVNWRNVPVTVEAGHGTVEESDESEEKTTDGKVDSALDRVNALMLLVSASVNEGRCPEAHWAELNADLTHAKEKLSRIQSLVQKRAGKLPLGAPERHFCREVRRICVSRRICEPRR
ncbi:unnamed protein product [Durusdinium trenchii]|uniref:Uncharacterized protein n=1 Tax=Durusdinium trenchii TaxID=1381693 RepID=A0ABP0LP73_9DINO